MQYIERKLAKKGGKIMIHQNSSRIPIPSACTDEKSYVGQTKDHNEMTILCEFL